MAPSIRTFQQGLRWFLLLILTLALPRGNVAVELGGEVAFFNTRQMQEGVNHRQDVCGRYNEFHSTPGSELRKGLNGMQLNVVVGNYLGADFNYDPVTGIDPEYPGIAAVVLDELAARGNFTWRNSFGVYTDPVLHNGTWSDLLYWSLDTYDVVIDWWARSLDRMNKGAVFIEPWKDSSIILVGKNREQEESTHTINLWNWLLPYNFEVWAATIFTVIISAVVYQLLEWFADDRRDREFWQWCQENFYLSAINFTQAYEYQPKTFSMRMFGISMAIWALVMTATYTANLASLLVDRMPPPGGPQTLADISFLGYRVCVWEGTHTENYLKAQAEDIISVPKATSEEVFQGLRDGDCDFMLQSADNWNKKKAQREYNPQCNLYWVGGDRKLEYAPAGFVTKGDAGKSCTSFIRDVLDIHMHDMVADGTLEAAWEKEYKLSQTIDCNTYKPLNTTHRRARALQLRHSKEPQSPFQPQDHGRNDLIHRRLKAGGKAAAGGAVAKVSAAGSGAQDERRLTFEQMIGTFAFHWGLMLIALVLASGKALYRKHTNLDTKFSAAHQPNGETSNGGKSQTEPSSWMTDDEDNSKREVQELKKQLAAMQLHLQLFEQRILEKQEAAFESQQVFQERIQRLMESSRGNELLSCHSEAKSLCSGDIPPLNWD